MTYSSRRSPLAQPHFTPAVKALLIGIVAVFILQLSFRKIGAIPLEFILGFTPQTFLTGAVWQIFTYPFLHGGPSHIFFNGLVLYMLGPELESRWGTRRFLKFFAVCAVGGAILQTLIWLMSLPLFPELSESLGAHPIIGASGALYGLFMAFGKLYGESRVLVFFVFPMKARHFVMLLAGVEIISAVFYSESGVAHLVHLGGLATGFLYLWFRGPNLDGRGGRGGGGFWKKRGNMDRDEMRRRLNLIVNDGSSPPHDKSDSSRDGTKDRGKFPITWN